LYAEGSCFRLHTVSCSIVYTYPRHSTSFPTRRSSDPVAGLTGLEHDADAVLAADDHRVGAVPVRRDAPGGDGEGPAVGGGPGDRSEEDTSELQSRENLECRLLHEKKKNKLDLNTVGAA